MKRRFSASVWREDDWYVAQCLEFDVASQGRTEEEAVVNLREAIELAMEEPGALVSLPKIVTVEIEVNAA
jgi:predicted RNase H-like HicB family nuclease